MGFAAQEHVAYSRWLMDGGRDKREAEGTSFGVGDGPEGGPGVEGADEVEENGTRFRTI